MSQALWSKTALAQAVGLTVAGAGVASVAQADSVMPSLSLTTYDLNLRSDDFSGGAYGTNSNSSLADGREEKLKITLPASGQRDFAFSLTRSNDINATSDDKYSFPFGTSTNAKTNYDIIDFEAGHNSTLGNTATRISAGLRYIDLDQDIKANFSYASKYGGAVYRGKHDLKALGVRVAGEFDMPLSKGLSVSGALGGSLLYGKRDSDYTPKYASAVSKDDNDTIYGVDSEVALNYDLSPGTPEGTTLSLGYTWAKTYNLIQTNTDENYGDGVSDVTQDGWFVRLKSTF